MTGLIIGLTIASAAFFIGAALAFLATLKLYTEYFKDKSAASRGPKGGDHGP